MDADEAIEARMDAIFAAERAVIEAAKAWSWLTRPQDMHEERHACPDCPLHRAVMALEALEAEEE